MGCPIPPFYGPSNGRGRFERSFFDRPLVPRPQKVQKGVILGGTPNGPFGPHLDTPLLGPLGAPGGGGAIWVPLRPV